MQRCCCCCCIQLKLKNPNALFRRQASSGAEINDCLQIELVQASNFFRIECVVYLRKVDCGDELTYNGIAFSAIY
ncbi:hypothetical protein T01_4880 [Trichinella spiralis]|uniref:Uncharacterized protein n=1 Tax=Trichinella spiralis TaxID=6334 RepID=A0A0V1AQE1_TRISP|nr:hypothetical protein T01_4880 [Trichinella spiralis]